MTILTNVAFMAAGADVTFLAFMADMAARATATFLVFLAFLAFAWKWGGATAGPTLLSHAPGAMMTVV